MEYIDNLLDGFRNDKKIAEMLEAAKKEREKMFIQIKNGDAI